MSLFKKKVPEPATISLAFEPTRLEEQAMATTITFTPGNDGKRANFRLGEQFIPQSMATRLLKQCEGKSGTALDRAVFVGLRLHDPFLNAMENAGITPASLLEQIKAQMPVKAKKGTRTRSSKIAKIAEVLAKVAARRFSSGTVEDVLADLQKTIQTHEFQKEFIDILKNYETQFGHTPSGQIKVSNRKANPNALKGLKAAREAKKK